MTDESKGEPKGYHGKNPFKRLSSAWHEDLGHTERAAILSWASFTTTFVGTRALTHWIKDGHGPSGGGMSMGGRHFHHYNIGIAALSALSGVSMRWGETFNTSPLHPLAYGFANALIADEAALLLDLEDVYWAKEGRKSVDIAVGTIGIGGAVIAAVPWLTNSRSRVK